MKILITSGAYPPHVIGGGEIATQRLAEALQDAGLDVTVLAGCNYDTEEWVNGVRVIRTRIPHVYWLYDHIKVNRHGFTERALYRIVDSFNIAVYWAVQAHVLREHPDILFISVVDGMSPLIFRLGRIVSLHVIYVLRSYVLCCLYGFMFRSGRICDKQCIRCRFYSLPKQRSSRYVDGVISVSRYTLRKHLEAGFFRAAQTTVIGDIVDLPAVSRTRKPQEKLQFGFIGRIEPEKGLELIIHALDDEQLRSRCEVVVAGSGREDYLRYLQDKARGYPIRWLGWVKAEDFFAEVDVVVVPSLWPEPQGLVVLEAYMCGIPVIASRSGGLPENVHDGETGFLLREARAQEVRSCMAAIVNSPENLAAMGDKARNYAAGFVRSSVAEKHLRFFDSILQR